MLNKMQNTFQAKWFSKKLIGVLKAMTLGNDNHLHQSVYL